MAYNLNATQHPLKNGCERVTSDYGYRTDPITGKKSSFHGGIDLISSKYGTDYIVAFEEGVVKSVTDNITWSYASTKSLSGISSSLYSGNCIEIDHGNGYSTRYLHLKHGTITVKKGDKVTKGQSIAYMGTTGYSTGNHLHFEVRLNGERLDPKPYLLGEKAIKTTPKEETSSPEIKGIDVSKWQGDIDWAKVKASGIKFAMIRLGYGSTDGTQCGVDSYFHKNVVNALKAGINIGCYFYSYAMSVEAARKEAEFVVNTLKSYKAVFTYPIAFDLEDPEQQKLGKTTLTNMVIAFGDFIEKAGYYCSLYSNLNWLRNILDDSKLTRFDHWVAQWYEECTYSNKSITGMWQYSSTGKVDGISGNVDLDIAYHDYPAIIRNYKLNGFTYANQAPVIPADNTPETSQKPSEAVKPSTPTENTTPAFKVGDIVKIVGEKYNPTSSKVPAWVKTDYTHVITQTTSKGKKVIKGGKECVLLGKKIKNGTTKQIAGINTWVAIDCIEAVSPVQQTITHKVVKGDSLWAIATKYLGKGSRYPEIKSLNGLTSNTIYVGQVLKIPNK